MDQNMNYRHSMTPIPCSRRSIKEIAILPRSFMQRNGINKYQEDSRITTIKNLRHQIFMKHRQKNQGCSSIRNYNYSHGSNQDDMLMEEDTNLPADPHNCMYSRYAVIHNQGMSLWRRRQQKQSPTLIPSALWDSATDVRPPDYQISDE